MPEIPNPQMLRVLTVGELRAALSGFPDDYPMAHDNMGGNIQVSVKENGLEVAYEDYL